MKHLVEVKAEIGQKIYVVFGDPSKQIILSAKISGIAINANSKEERGYTIYYTYSHIKLANKKAKLNKTFAECGSVDECLIDIDCISKKQSSIEMHNWPVFTSKEKCIAYLKNFK